MNKNRTVYFSNENSTVFVLLIEPEIVSVLSERDFENLTPEFENENFLAGQFLL